MKAVFLSYVYPPLQAPRAVQVHRLARFSKLDIRVLASVNGPAPRPGVEVVSFPDEPNRSWKLMRRAFYLPDPQRFWAMRVAKEAPARGLVTGDDVLITFGQPMSDHLAGLALKQRVGMPWIAHFSDPWADNPYRLALPFSARANAAMEKKVIAAADRVLFTSPDTVDLVMAKYPRSWRAKASVLPHAFDPDLVKGAAEKSGDGALVLRYLGNFYGQRNPRRFAEALKLILAEAPALLDGVRIELIGRWVGHANPTAASLGLSHDVLVFRNSVPYARSLELMTGADALLILDASFEHNVFFPSKLADYLGSDRPIIAVTPGGTTADIVSRAGGRVISPMSVEEMAEGLKTTIADLCAGRLAPSDPRYVAHFAGPEVGAQFDAIVDEVTGAGADAGRRSAAAGNLDPCAE